MTKTTPKQDYHVGNLSPQLLVAARQILESVGPSKLSLRAVSKQVGVSSAAAYHHFPNRLDLVAHVAAQGFRELGKAIGRINLDLDKKSIIKQSLLAYYTFARNNPKMYQLMFGEELSGSQGNVTFAKARDEAFNHLVTGVARAINEAPEDSATITVAVSLWAYAHGLTSMVIQGAIVPSTEASNEHFVNKLFHGISSVLRDI